MTAATIERTDVAPDVVEQIATGVRDALPCEWWPSWEPEQCPDRAAWNLAPPCGHDGNLCTDHRTEWLNLVLDGKLEGKHFLFCPRGCPPVRVEAMVWTPL